MAWESSLKLARCWWILNCHKSRELPFSEILGGGLNSLGGRGGGGAAFFTHKLLYKNLTSLFPWIHISQNLKKVLYFSQISQFFSLIFLFMQVSRSVVFNSPGHDMTLALGGSKKADREKAFLQSLIIFVVIPDNEKLT